MPVRPTFTWQAEQGRLYDIEVATDAAFTNVVASGTGLTSPSYTPAEDLPANTLLYWHVRGSNTCGDTPWSEVRRFVTEAGIAQCALGTKTHTLLGEGFEGNVEGWTTGGTGSTWTASTTRKHSGTYSYKAFDQSIVTDQWLISPAIALPTGQSPLNVIFWNYRKFQVPGCADGSVLEISTNGGSTWTSLGSRLQVDPYNGSIDSNTNPLYGQNAWCGTNASWLNTIASLDEYAGQTVQLRFRLGTDDAIGYEGWYVDDISVQSCMPSTELGPDSSLLAVPGEAVIHSFTLANLGTATDSFALAVSGGSWPTELMGSSPITLTAGATATLSVRVEVPVDFSSPTDSFTLTATSLGIPGISLQAQGETSLGIEAGAAFSAAQSGAGQAGEMLEYVFTLTNQGNYTDTYTLSLSGEWNTYLPGGMSVGPLGAGESVTVTLLVAIPTEAVQGDSDVTILTATSSLDGSVAVSVNATTSVVVYYRNYLPILNK